MSTFKVSSNNTLCAAKWLQVTLDLYHGMSKSCHHTNWNLINIEDTRENINYLFNTKSVINERDAMLNGDQPAACSFCWDIEDTDKDTTSDRYIKTNSDWSQNYLDRINIDDSKKITIPSYLEVLFDHICNLSCLYCSADSSSTIEWQMSKNINVDNQIIKHRKKRYKKSPHQQEFISLFFNNLNNILLNLHTIRITGGEPLLSKDAQNLITYVAKYNYQHLTFGINTNLSLKSHLIKNFSSKIDLLKSKVKDIQLFVSIDSIYENASKIRKGLNFDLFDYNIRFMASEHQSIQIILMCTLTSLSLIKLKEFLSYVLELKKLNSNIILDINPLKEPSFLSILTLTKEERKALCDSLDFMRLNNRLFSQKEIDKLNMCVKISKGNKDANQKEIMQRDSLINDLSLIS